MMHAPMNYLSSCNISISAIYLDGDQNDQQRKSELTPIEHCCELMELFLHDPRVPLEYYPIAREYGVMLKDSAAIQLLLYCPWCGKKLPGSVREQYFNILEKEYGIESDLDSSHDLNIPTEFKSDEWWKKRGL